MQESQLMAIKKAETDVSALSTLVMRGLDPRIHQKNPSHLGWIAGKGVVYNAVCDGFARQ
jgi:hypothetical protein